MGLHRCESHLQAIPGCANNAYINTKKSVLNHISSSQTKMFQHALEGLACLAHKHNSFPFRIKEFVRCDFGFPVGSTN